MKHPRKIIFLTLFGVCTIVLLLWMRALASWRPVKIGRLDKSHQFTFFSRDGRTAFLDGDTLLDIQTTKATKWSDRQRLRIHFSQSLPQLVAILDGEGGKGELRVRDIKTNEVKCVFHWPTDVYYTPHILWSNDGQVIGVVDKGELFLWNIESKQLIRHVSLQDPIVPPADYSLDYAISPNKERILGCGVRRGKVWHAQTGHLVHSWPMLTPTAQGFFVADGRVVVCASPTAASVMNSLFLDASTGKFLWQTNDSVTKYCINNDEIIFQRQTNCEVLSVHTGRTKRLLPTPRQSDGEILRVTSDWIYTQNGLNEIVRWRAR